MQNSYNIALMILRGLAVANIATAAGLLGVSTAVALVMVAGKISSASFSEAIIGYLFDYGAASLIAGVTLLLASKRIARFVTKV